MQVIEYESLVDENQRIQLKEKQSHPVKEPFTTIANVKEFFEEEYKILEKADEYVYLVALNAANRPIGVFEISHGSQTQSLFNVREICSRVLILGAVGFLVVHNHPSGDTTPSESDLKATGILKSACEILGLIMLDHIIIGSEGCYSMNSNGILD